MTRFWCGEIFNDHLLQWNNFEKKLVNIWESYVKIWESTFWLTVYTLLSNAIRPTFRYTLALAYRQKIPARWTIIITTLRQWRRNRRPGGYAPSSHKYPFWPRILLQNPPMHPISRSKYTKHRTDIDSSGSSLPPTSEWWRHRWHKAQNPLRQFPRNFPVDGEAANFLWTCRQQVRNKLECTTSPETCFCSLLWEILLFNFRTIYSY